MWANEWRLDVDVELFYFHILLKKYLEKIIAAQSVVEGYSSTLL